MKTTITKEIVKWINYYDVSYDLDDPVKVYQEKAPELTDTIVNMIVEEIGGFDNVNISLEYKLGKELFRKHLTEQLLKD